MRRPRALVALVAGALLGAGMYAALPPEAKAPAGVREPEQPVKILFAGDLMLDRNVARAALSGAVALFSISTRELFAGADARVVNLEGTVTDNPSIAQQDHSILRFTFSPNLAARALHLLGISAVSLANNHTLDFGQNGYAETRANLDRFGVAAFGHPLNASSTLSTTLAIRGKTFCFVGYHALFSPDDSGVLAEIARLRPDCYRVIVFVHWGEEYEPLQTAAQTKAAHEFVDAGADLVIGAHPHVVEPIELYRGKAILYSLGNFMFDQDFSWATMHGLAVEADFYADKTAFVLTPLVVSDEYSMVASGADRDRVLQAAQALASFSLP